MADAISFCGEWVVDKARSASTLEPILQCMGLPWLAIQLVLRLDVTTEIAHQPSLKQVRTTDRTSLGVLSTNELCSDGVQVARVGKDGRTALLTCCVSGALPAGFEARELAGSSCAPLAYLRITTVLPDGEGVSDNVWEMRGGGRVMQAYTVFTRGGKVARAHRVMVNRAWLPGCVPEALPLAAVAEAEAPAAAVLLPAAAPPLAAAAAAAPAEAEGPAAFPLPQPPGDGAPDPFFVSLAGTWEEADGAAGGAPVGLVGQALQLVAGGVLAALRGGGPGAAAAAAAAPAPARTSLTIAHAAALPAPAPPCCHLTLAWPSLWGGGAAAAAPALPLDGAWRWHAPGAAPPAPGRARVAPAPAPALPVLVRAVQAEGQGDLGPAWLGHEVGTLPACLGGLPSHAAEDACVPHFSAAELDAALYATAEVRIEVLVPAAGEGGAGAGAGVGAGAGAGAVPPSALPRGQIHTLILRRQGGAGSALWVGATAEARVCSGGGGGGAGGCWSSAYPPSLRWSALAQAQAQARGGAGAAAQAAAAERARLGGVRAALLLRRAQADRERRLQYLARAELEGT